MIFLKLYFGKGYFKNTMIIFSQIIR